MAGNTRTGVRARVFEGKWEPKVGVLCLVALDTGNRPFLPVAVLEAEVHGWLFPLLPNDDASNDLRVRGLGPVERRAPCYCRVARAAVSPV